MSFSLHQQAVLTGSLHSFCLACDAILKTDADVPLHVQEPVHQKNLDTTPYFEKFKGQGIRKVKRGYYCEYCNTLLPIANKVSLHVADSSHVNNRGTRSLRLTGPDVVALDEVLIREKAWHGLTEDVCLLCNTEFDDESLHTSSVEHALNLVQKCIEFWLNDGIYRKVDNTTAQCLTCHTLLSSSTLADHFTDSEHLKLYKQCCKDNTDLERQCETLEDVMKITETNDTIEKPTDNIGKAAKEENTDNIIDDKMTNGARDDNITDSTTTIHEVPSGDVATFAKSNKITYNADDSNAYCRICDKRIPSNLQCMKQHVMGGPHCKNSTKMNTVPKYGKKSMDSFIDTAINIETAFRDDMIINEKYCVSLYSYLMLTIMETGLRCQACEVNVPRRLADVEKHNDTNKHTRAMKGTPVCTMLANEFIREVREGVFHCGYCNIVVGSWGELIDHIASIDHAATRRGAERRLEVLRPNIDQRIRQINARMEKQMFMRFMMSLL